MNKKQNNWLRFGLYAGLIVLLNLVSSTLFFRWDLTQNRIYSLSDASIQAVSTLEEPLTIRIFLSENLPQPYNTLEQELRDLMEEYALKGNQYFNYEIHLIDKQGEATNRDGMLLTDLASKYGVSPIEIQSAQDNQISLVSVYMGMVMVQGDLSNRVNALGQRGNLEFEFTAMMDELSAKTNTLLALEEDIQVKLIFSSSLGQLAPDFGNYPDELLDQVEALQSDFFNRLNFQHIDPDRDSQDLTRYNLNTYALGREGEESWVYAALVVERDQEFQKVELIERGLFGDRILEPQELSQPITDIADHLLQVQKVIGYLSDHGAPGLYDYSAYFQQPQQQSRFLQSFNQLVSQGYQLQPVTLDTLPQGLETLVIAGVTQPFTEWELFQLDQFLVGGGSLALFIDPFEEQMPQGQMAFYGGQPSYIPIDTGLERLLENHGISMKQSYVMDQQCFVSTSQAQGGGYQEIEIPFAPEIDAANINTELDFMANIKGLIMLNVAPLSLWAEMPQELEGKVIFSSSENAWEMAENINLNPQMIFPPGEEEMAQFPLAVLVEGEFQSLYSEATIPEAPQNQEELQEGQEALFQSSAVQQDLITSGEGKIFLVGSSYILGDNVLDPEGLTPNSLFVINSLDYLSGRGDYGVMRSKGQLYNPVDPRITSRMKTVVKVLNVVVLPLLVILFGLFMWFRWMNRKKRIALLFGGESL